MGRTVTRLAHAAEDIQVVGGACGAEDPSCGKDLGELSGVGQIGVVAVADVSSALLGADAIIDFSVAGAMRPLLKAVADAKVPLVTGTTNLDEPTEGVLEDTAKVVPVLWAPNMSMGIQVLCEVLEHAIKRLGGGYDIEIVETHHRRKIDAPSGTARRLADVVKSVKPEVREVSGRAGEVGARTDDEMAVFALRGGDIPGDHTVYLIGESERIELSHRAINRDLFAHGAIRAARFLLGKSPGRYSIADVLG